MFDVVGCRNGAFPPGSAVRPSTIRFGSVGAVRHKSVTACVSTADSTLYGRAGYSRMAIAAAAT